MALFSFHQTPGTKLTLEEAKLVLQKCVEDFCDSWKPDWPTALSMDDWHDQFESFQLIERNKDE